MAAPPSKCIFVGGQAISLCLFSEDGKNLKFIGETEYSLNFAVQWASFIPR